MQSTRVGSRSGFEQWGSTGWVALDPTGVRHHQRHILDKVHSGLASCAKAHKSPKVATCATRREGIGCGGVVLRPEGVGFESPGPQPWETRPLSGLRPNGPSLVGRSGHGPLGLRRLWATWSQGCRPGLSSAAPVGPWKMRWLAPLSLRLARGRDLRATRGTPDSESPATMEKEVREGSGVDNDRGVR